MTSFIIHFLLLLQFNSTGLSQNDALLSCVEKYDAKWGEDCSQCLYDKDTYSVFFKNVCDEVLDIKCAVQEEDLYWRTFTFLDVEPDQKFQGYACKGTGKYQYWVKLSGDNSYELPSDEQINLRKD